MKKEFIQKVVESVSFLNKEQVEMVKYVLIQELQNVELVRSLDEKGRIECDNKGLLNSFISAKRIEGCSEKTLKYYENTLLKFFETISFRATEAETNTVREYLAQYQEVRNSSKVTIDNMRRIFSSFYAWLEDEDYIVKSPVRRIHKVRTDTLVKEVLTDEELEQLRDNCTNLRDLAMIDLLASTGIRVGELVKMNRSDVDFNERQCVVFGKGNKEREVYFNARTKLHLQQYLDSRTDNNPALFVSLDAPYTRLNISGVEVRLRRLGSLCNIHKVHPHKFRRTLATMAIDKGMPIEQVQRLLGHCKIDTTLHYAMVNQNNVKIAHRRFIP